MITNWKEIYPQFDWVDEIGLVVPEEAKVEFVSIDFNGNLIDLNKLEAYGKGVITNDGNGFITLTVSEAIETNQFIGRVWIDIEPNTEYKIFAFDYSTNMEAPSLKSYLYSDALLGNKVINGGFYLNSGVIFNSGEYNKVLLGFYAIPSVSEFSPNTFQKFRLSLRKTSQPDEYVPYQENRTQIVYKDENGKPARINKGNPLKEFDYVKDNKLYMGSGLREYEADDETNLNVITDMNKTMYQLAEPKVYNLIKPITLLSYEGTTKVVVDTGDAIPSMKFKIIANSVDLAKSNLDRITNLENLVLKYLYK